MDFWRADLQFVLSSFRQARGFAAAAVLTLALGVGGTATIFAVINSVILKPLPYPESERLMRLTVSVNMFPGARMGVSPGMLTQISAMTDVIDAAALYANSQRRALSADGDPETVVLQQASSDFFDVLRVSPIIGRRFARSDVEPGSDEGAVVVLSHAFWSRRFGSDPNIIGRTIVLDGQSHEVIGVMPQGFAFPVEEVEAWSPAVLGDRYGGYGWRGIARLRPGVSVQQAEARLNSMVPHLAQAFPASRVALGAVKNETRLHASLLKTTIVWEALRRVLWTVLGAATFVLLMAWANVVNLFLARAEERRRDMAVRSALGAEPGRLMRHFFAEGIALAAVGGLLGLGLSVVAIRVVRHFGPVDLPRISEVGVDTPVVVFAAMVALCSGIICGLVGLAFRDARILGALGSGGPGGHPGRTRLRSALVASQIAFALMLLIGSGLMIRSFWHLAHVDPGFDATNVLTFDVQLGSRYPGREAQVAFQNALMDRLTGLSGVLDVAASTCIPLRDRCPGGSNLREKDVVVLHDPPPIIPSARGKVSAGFFETMRVPLLQGRFLTPGPDDSLSVMLSASLAHDRWPGEDPIGRLVALGDWSDPAPARWYTVIGVVGDLPVSMRLPPLPSEITRVMYFPTSAPDVGLAAMTFVMRTATPPLHLVNAVRRTVWSMDPDLPVDRVDTMEQYVKRARAPMAFFMTLVVIGGIAALLLGMVGIYGVVAHTVGRRTREIGVRMALGATPPQVVGMVVREGALVAAAGAAIGLAGALSLTHLIDAVVLGVSPTDPATYLVALVGLLGMALIFTYLPARRASSVDPVVALGSD